MRHPPTYIAVEGIDGSGKSTFVDGLYDYLRNVHEEPVWPHREPGGPTVFGTVIRRLLKDPTHGLDEHTRALLFFADRRHSDYDVREALDSGRHVVSDRSFVSSLVYQSERGVDVDFLEDLLLGVAIQHPDLYVFVDTPVEVAQARLRDRRADDDDRYDADAAFQECVRSAYSRYFDGKGWFAPFVRIDGSRPFTDEDYERVSLAMHRCHQVNEGMDIEW